MIKFQIVFLLLLININSFADTQTNCAPVDFRIEFPLIMRNQKSVAWCFAHASADNLQFAEKANEQISAADIAINYGKSRSSRIMNLFQRWTSQNSQGEENRPNEYGLAMEASEMIYKQGYCPESLFPSEDWKKIMKDGSVYYFEIIDAVEDIYKLALDIKNKKYKAINEIPYWYDFKYLRKDIFFNILKSSRKEDILDKLRMAACDLNRFPFKNKIDIKMNVNSKKIFKKMDMSLKNGKTFSIDLYSQVFKNIDNNKNKLTNLHTVIVYGRKYDSVQSKCLYLIKNSYSENCDGYDSRLQCDHGYLWFPEDILRKNMTSVVFYN